MPLNYNVVGFETLSVTGTAGSLAAASTVIKGMKSAVFVLETGQIRYRLDGTAPTATEGVLMEIGGLLIE